MTTDEVYSPLTPAQTARFDAAIREALHPTPPPPPPPAWRRLLTHLHAPTPYRAGRERTNRGAR